jgi:hypothetical protein
MTERARRVLQDCKFALEKFESGPVIDEFRLTLVLCLTLLRSVGHVLKNEAQETTHLQVALDSTWPEKKRSPIFIEFIEEYRNKVVKEYRSPVRWVSHSSVEDNRSWMEYPITAGQYTGRDVREVIQEAIAWWEGYLVELETMLANEPR